MCFSAEASFIAAAGLSVMGAITLKKAPSKPFVPLASIALMFALQQFSEGVVWLAMQGFFTAEWILPLATYVYLFFATAVWPSFVPFAFWQAEMDFKRRRYLRCVLAYGVLITMYNLYGLFIEGTSVAIVDHSLQYDTDYFLWQRALYVLAVVPPFFLSSLKYAGWVGLVGFFACVLAQILYTMTFTSVWCFFAAIISILFYWIVHVERQSYL